MLNDNFIMMLNYEQCLGAMSQAKIKSTLVAATVPPPLIKTYPLDNSDFKVYFTYVDKTEN